MRGILIRLLLTALSAAGFSVLVYAPSYADTVCSATQRRASASSGSRCRARRVRRVSQVTTDRRTPAAERPATGMARAKHHETARAGALLIARGLLVEQLSLLHQSGRAPAAGGRPSWQGHEPGDGRCTTATSRRRVCSSPSGRRTRPGLRHGTNAARGGADRDRADASVCHQHRHRARAGSGQHRTVGMPVWMWAKNPNAHTVGPITESASAGGITVTATAKVLDITWDMGDGTEVVCNTAGTPYKPEFGRKDSPTAATPTRSRAPARRMTPTPSPRPRVGSSPGRARARPGRSASTASTARPRSGSAKRRCS